MLIVELIVFCLIFTVMVRLSAMGGAINALYYYPENVQEKAIEKGMITKEAMKQKRKRFMIVFYIVMIATLVVMIGVINHVHDFWNAYVQCVIFLEVMNWYDGIVIDKIWVGYSKFWQLPGLEDMEYVPTWPQVLKKRSALTVIFLFGGLIGAAIIILV